MLVLEDKVGQVPALACSLDDGGAEAKDTRSAVLSWPYTPALWGCLGNNNNPQTEPTTQDATPSAVGTVDGRWEAEASLALSPARIEVWSAFKITWALWTSEFFPSPLFRRVACWISKKRPQNAPPLLPPPPLRVSTAASTALPESS